jgi:hypothetical protein
MKGNCAMDGRFAFNAEVNITKVGNFAKDGNVATKGQQNKVCRPGWQHVVPGTAINNAWVWVVDPNGNQ